MSKKIFPYVFIICTCIFVSKIENVKAMTLEEDSQILDSLVKIVENNATIVNDYELRIIEQAIIENRLNLLQCEKEYLANIGMENIKQKYGTFDELKKDKEMLRIWRNLDDWLVQYYRDMC